MYQQGLHYVGDWHTHPEQIPKPSLIDLSTFKSIYLKSESKLPVMIFLIVGTAKFPDGIWFGEEDGNLCRHVQEISNMY